MYDSSIFIDKSKKTKRLIPSQNISIWLDTYDDIFSDFDYRQFSEKALSDDFLTELQKMYREK